MIEISNEEWDAMIERNNEWLGEQEKKLNKTTNETK